jgi:tetratricopeptide (TPR) repeat protein
MADRYSYLPSVGLFLAVVWFIADLAALRHPRAVTVTAGFVIAIYAAIAIRQVRYWRDSDTLLRHAIDATGSNWFAHDALGDLAYDRGDIREAIDEYDRSLADRDANPEANAGLGNCWQSDPARAVVYFRRSVASLPQASKYRISLARALFQLNDREDLEEAAAQLRTVLSNDPQNSAAVIGLAQVQSRLRTKSAGE